MIFCWEEQPWQVYCSGKDLLDTIGLMWCRRRSEYLLACFSWSLAVGLHIMAFLPNTRQKCRKSSKHINIQQCIPTFYISVHEWGQDADEQCQNMHYSIIYLQQNTFCFGICCMKCFPSDFSAEKSELFMSIYLGSKYQHQRSGNWEILFKLGPPNLLQFSP